MESVVRMRVFMVMGVPVFAVAHMRVFVVV